MPRDSNGNYTLPAGNPVTPGTVIESVWANTTMDDIATALTNSLDRYGNGGMLAPFAFADGSRFAPGATWLNENTSGLYRADRGDLRVSILTQDVARFLQSGLEIWDNDAGVWRGVVTEGTSGTVPPGGEDPGDPANDGQTLRWNVTGQAWEAQSFLRVPEVGGEVYADAIFRVRAAPGADAAIAGLRADEANPAALFFGDTIDEDIGGIIYATADNSMSFQTNNLVQAVLTTDGNFGIGVGALAPTSKLQVDGEGSTSLGLIPGIVGAKKLEVVAALPATPDTETIYFVTG